MITEVITDKTEYTITQIKKESLKNNNSKNEKRTKTIAGVT
jgi:hypothetical protein